MFAGAKPHNKTIFSTIKDEKEEPAINQIIGPVLLQKLLVKVNEAGKKVNG